MGYCLYTNEKKMQICPPNLNFVLLFLRNSKATYWRSNAWSLRWADRNCDCGSCKTYDEKEKFRKLFKSPFGQILKSAGTLHYPSSLLTYVSPALVSLAQVTSLFPILHVDVLPFLILAMSHYGHFQFSYPSQQFWDEQETMPAHSLPFYTARFFFPQMWMFH